jgi:TrpR-related protein YerC/YecD
MTDSVTQLWNKPTAAQLVQVLVAIDDMSTMQKFLRDALTEKEIVEIAARLEAAKMLKSGATYTEIVSKTRLSSRTIARISGWLQTGCKGYDAALQIIKTHHAHIPPVRAE